MLPEIINLTVLKNYHYTIKDIDSIAVMILGTGCSSDDKQTEIEYNVSEKLLTNTTEIISTIRGKRLSEEFPRASTWRIYVHAVFLHHVHTWTFIEHFTDG